MFNISMPKFKNGDTIYGLRYCCRFCHGDKYFDVKNDKGFLGKARCYHCSRENLFPEQEWTVKKFVAEAFRHEEWLNSGYKDAENSLNSYLMSELDKSDDFVMDEGWIDERDCFETEAEAIAEANKRNSSAVFAYEQFVEEQAALSESIAKNNA